MSLAMNPDCFAGIVVYHSLDLTSKFRSCFFNIKTFKVMLRSWHNVLIVGFIQLFSNFLLCPQIDPKTLWIFFLFIVLPVWMTNSTSCRYKISGWVNCIMELLSSRIAQGTPVYCTTDKSWNKKVHAQKL